MALPDEEGVYEVFDDTMVDEIDVYFHPIKGFCTFWDSPYFINGETYDDTDCHVSVTRSGYRFGKKLRNIE